MSASKTMTRFKLLAEAISIIAEDVRRNVREPQAHDDAQDEYMEERLIIAASDFLDAHRGPRKPTKEQDVLESIMEIFDAPGNNTIDAVTNARVQIENRLQSIKMEDADKVAEDQKRKVQEMNMARENFLRELARSFGAHGSGNSTFERESEDFALFAMETTKCIERQAFERVVQFFKDAGPDYPSAELTPGRIAAHIETQFVDGSKEL
jgi:hypothetical protein